MKKILPLFIVWRVFLFVILLFALATVPLQLSFLGGGLSNYLRNPQLWSWVNFDGEHYLSIAFRGYCDLEYFYFPLYPILINTMAQLFNGSMVGYAVVGLVVSHASFLIGLIGLIKLIRLDYGKKITFYTVALLLLFPTSFYFGSFYTESLFFALVVWSFYFARKKKWLLAGVLGGLSTATRIVGLAFLPALVVEIFLEGGGGGRLRRVGLKELLGVLLIPLGLVVYMLWLNKVTGDPLEFLHSVSIFGQQRSSSFVMLPQVFYRYVFKILPNINYDYFPVVFTTWLEFLVAVLFGIVGILGVLGSLGLTLSRPRGVKKLGKMRSSYVVYLVFGYLIPALSGSFSSLPRYVLVLFPAFIFGALFLSTARSYIKYLVFAILLICLGVATALFTRGYWLS